MSIETEQPNNSDNADSIDTESTVVQQTCYLCTNTEIVGVCLNCKQKFCLQDTNKLDSRYCAECMSDIVIEEKTFTRTYQEYDPDTDICHTETRSCKDILFNGIDWMFACKRLSEMSDVEAKTELEYHRAMVHFLESDLLTRSVKTYRMKVQTDLDEKHAKRAATIKRITETKSRKTVKLTKEFDPIAFAKTLLAMGITNINQEKKI